jgi:hypothetical protein
MKVYGPYVRKQDGRKIVIEYDGIKRKGKLYARYLLEQKIGRTLRDKEEVDHKDGDRTNDSIENLRILSGTSNRREANLRRYGPKIKVKCAYCNKMLERSKSRINSKLNFCNNTHSNRFKGL